MVHAGAKNLDLRDVVANANANAVSKLLLRHIVRQLRLEEVNLRV